MIHVNDTSYLRKEDIATYIRDLGIGEVTDVKNRLGEAADNILCIDSIQKRVNK
jgi:hypothetical protein